MDVRYECSYNMNTVFVQYLRHLFEIKALHIAASDGSIEGRTNGERGGQLQQKSDAGSFVHILRPQKAWNSDSAFVSRPTAAKKASRETAAAVQLGAL
jgi:hypothetical protein